ncbi:zinc finger protein 830 [Leptopilina boulardi]|uniref:zinc finger protein 830 n=1 Tax=Leptopilina boulardi TaxID=63433 RepID=UPI0021F68F40|nr:zinc finger protein 830 [Leptopilina boulardi]
MCAKKALTQQELRKIMNNTKQKLGVQKKIESPLAKYNSLGQLTCIICKITISNEAAWPIHINSKKHKENIENAKQQLEKAKSSVSGQKRSSSTFQEPQPVKKVKGILKNSNSRTTTISQTKSQLPADFFDNKSSTIKSGSLTNGKTNSVKISSNIESSESMIVDEECDDNDDKQLKAKDNASALPEGFFDDPVLDARVRNVEYKDPIEEEWEKFKKEIKEEEAQANQIIADDQEEATAKRQEDVIEEQLQRLSKVMDLVRLKEKMQSIDRKQENLEKESSSSDDDDVDEFLDWRAKKSYK